ncbi:MAG: response regulator [Tabrizicola sp.]|nr:response regulator [Tabrizicola sp.]
MTFRWVASGQAQPLPRLAEIAARSAKCLVYSAVLDGTALSLEWSVGQAGRFGDLLPIRDALGRDPRFQAPDSVVAHIERLRLGRSSEARFAIQNGAASDGFVHDSATAEGLDGNGRVRITGIVREVIAATTQDDPGIAGWPRVAVEAMDQGIACWDRQSRLVYWNPEFESFAAGLGAPVAKGRALAEFLSFLAASREIVLNEVRPPDWIAGVLDDKARERTSEWLLSNGRSVDVGWRDLDGASMTTVQDVTRSRNAERALRDAKRLAEEANDKKSRFLRAASHDLRQPLATLKILVYSGIESRSEEELRDLLRSMDVAVSVMDEILGLLLQVGQLDANRITVQRHHFQASQMLDRLRREFTPIAEKKGLTLRVLDSAATLETDRALLERILGNFIANAIRFTETGGILVGLRNRGAHKEIQVWDTGCGIPKEHFKKIFEEFHQVEGNASGRQRGLGLGLNIAQRIAGLLSHNLRVTSRPGRGSMFSVEVPTGNIWQSRVGEPEISEGLAGEFFGASALVIEDNDNFRAAMEGMLARWGVKVLAARDGDGALSLIRSHAFRPDIILVDYSFPDGQTGTEILGKARAELQAQTPGIVCTADTDPDLLNAIRASGVPLLIKPVSPVRLRSVMHHLLYENPDRVA